MPSLTRKAAASRSSPSDCASSCATAACGAEALAGRGEIDLAGERLRKADIELAAAGNQLSAKGAFGAPGDRLTVSIAAPKLDLLGVAGDLAGVVVVGGGLKTLQLSADVHSTRLTVAGIGQLRRLDLEAELGNGSQGALVGKLRLAGLDLPGGETVAQDLQLDAQGVRSRHSLRGQLALPGKRGLRLLLEGGLTAQTAGLSWAGTLSELTLSSVVDAQRPFVSLASAMPLQVAAAGRQCRPGRSRRRRLVGPAGAIALRAGPLADCRQPAFPAGRGSSRRVPGVVQRGFGDSEGQW
jgi:translocation and assembly module TamB